MTLPCTSFFRQFQLKIFVYFEENSAYPFFSEYFCYTIERMGLKRYDAAPLFNLRGVSAGKSQLTSKHNVAQSKNSNEKGILIRNNLPSVLLRILGKSQSHHSSTCIDYS